MTDEQEQQLPEEPALPDPETGARTWTALVRREDGVRDDRPLLWRTDSGERPTDEYLAEVGYAGLIETPAPAHDPLTHRAVKRPWQIDGAEIVEAWDVVALNSQEQADALAAHKEMLAAHAADTRWQVECGGLEAGGVQIATDDRSKMMIGFAQARALANPAYMTGWKGADGAFVMLDASVVIAIANAVAAHVEACFALEATVLAAIAAGTMTTTAEIDAAFAQM
ncbi:MAG: DUF4376 domain-containing protein [Parvibaculum sp.]|uniref:DUF4376 domain-containing protein n=1 Tax=Parvibaculum sp. TaxID=2024848 RepID=UPI002715E20E|nr:DUF4376 domain-containing protein [Parvibaculum sp.]MDO8840673.1 DUF4376 domain-containing protein [Parvibaculum sp.]